MKGAFGKCRRDASSRDNYLETYHLGWNHWAEQRFGRDSARRGQPGSGAQKGSGVMCIVCRAASQGPLVSTTSHPFILT